jgi:hypothetical protein
MKLLRHLDGKDSHLLLKTLISGEILVYAMLPCTSPLALLYHKFVFFFDSYI